MPCGSGSLHAFVRLWVLAFAWSCTFRPPRLRLGCWSGWGLDVSNGSSPMGSFSCTRGAAWHVRSPVASNPSFDWIVWFALDLGVEGVRSSRLDSSIRMGLVSFGEKYELRKGRAESVLLVSLGRDAEVRHPCPNGTHEMETETWRERRPGDPRTIADAVETRVSTQAGNHVPERRYGNRGTEPRMGKVHPRIRYGILFQQSVPDNKWYLVPSPVVKVKKSFNRKNISVEGKADLLDHRSALAIEGKPTNWSKLDVEFTKAGLSNGTLGISRKMKELHLDTCGIKYNLRKGPEASMSLKPLPNTKAKAKLVPRLQTVELGLDSTIENNGKKKTEWTATCKVDYQCKVKAACVEYKWFF
eukprot:scaffold1949_cov348-Pavlova_lutheri.AAC.12